MERLKNSPKVVGLKQSQKMLRAGKAEIVFCAEDAEAWLGSALEELAAEHNVPVVRVPSMKELAKACRVEVPTACAVILRSETR